MKVQLDAHVMIGVTVAAIFILSFAIASGAFGSSGLKVIVKIKYSDLVRELGPGKAVIDYRADHDSLKDYKSKTFNADKFPKSMTIQFSKNHVAVGEGFQICLSSFKFDEGSCANGVNSPGKSPETVRLSFPH